MNPKLIFEASIRFPDRMGIYVEQRMSAVLALDATVTKQFVVAYSIGMMPERSVKHVKYTKVPDRDTVGQWNKVAEFAGETRGWRTVLIRLLQERLIKLYQVEKHFPANDKSEKWQKLVS